MKILTGNPADISEYKTMRLTDAEYCARARKGGIDLEAKYIIPEPSDPAAQRNYRESDQQTSRLMGTLICSAIVTVVFLWTGPAAVLFGIMGGIVAHEFIKNGQDRSRA